MDIARFARRATNWVGYRIRLRAPKLSARLTLELPLRPAEGVFTEVAPWHALIPNVVYQTWVEPRFGRTHRHELRRLRERNADFSFRFFSDDDLDAYMAREFGEHPILEVFRNAQFGPMRSDIWRYCMLFRQGGIYCDIGKSIGVPFHQLLTPDTTALISWERRGAATFDPSPAARACLQHPERTVINWALFFTAGHPLLKRVIDGIVAKYPDRKGRSYANPKAEILRFTGPVHLTECVLAAAEAGELDGVAQAGLEFHDSSDWGVPGSWVRYIDRAPYELAHGQVIVR